jgi:L-iditol 2-dehydrogenase/L-idonate 5-dehydrogenase
VADLRVESLPSLVPAPDEAVIAIEYGGICGSDLHYWRHGAAGESVLRHPMILGHEVGGVVVRQAADGSGPPAGTRVAVHPATPGTDQSVRWPADRPNISVGGSYLGSAALDPHRDGGFATQVALPTRMLRTFPPDVDPIQAALVEPASVAWHAVARAGEISGRRVLVTGCGPIGCLIVAIAKLRGASEVIAADVNQATRALAERMGADRWIHAAELGGAGIEPDVVLEASGSLAGVGAAVRSVMRGGRVVLVGLVPSGDQPFPVSTVISRELDVVGAFRFNDEIDDVIAAVERGELDLSAVVSQVVDLDDAVRGFELAASSNGGKVLIRFSA